MGGSSSSQKTEKGKIKQGKTMMYGIAGTACFAKTA
jgi:hypothetical protein